VKRWLVFVFVLGCGDTTETTVSQLNLDRPTGITFGCVGGMRVIPDDRPDQTMPSVDDEVVISAMPTTACDIRSGDHDTADPAPAPPGQEDLTSQGGIALGSSSWFAFILQTAPGTVALAQFGTKPSTSFAGGDVSVLDAAPLTPGKNAISVGEEPIAIITDPSGCKVMTANAGSCDLSALDVESAVDFDDTTPIDVRRFDVVTTAGVPLRAKPAAMVVEPSSTVIGKECPATTTGAAGLAYVAYPGCRLVAALDLGSATIVGGVRFDDAGSPVILQTAELATLTCPDECAAELPATGVHPVTLDLEQDARSARRRLAIGANNSPAITMVELNGNTSMPESLAQLTLDGDIGVTRLALTPEIGMGGELHMIDDAIAPGGPFQFVYAIATDNTVRVADVLDLNRECDTQVDARFLRTIPSVKQLSCMPVDDPETPRRRPGARGPGIQLIGDGVPISVDIIRSQVVAGDSRLENDPGKLIGYFAIIGASNGGVFVVNIDDDDRRDVFSTLRPLLTEMPLVVAHQLRDAISDRGALAEQEDDDGVVSPVCTIDSPDDEDTTTVTGGPRSIEDPVRNFATDVVSNEKVFELPGFRRLTCSGSDGERAVYETSFAAPEAVRDQTFPDLATVFASETWTLTWEGSLSRDAITTAVDGPAVREGQIRVDGSGMHVVDATQPFCNTGVETFDIVQLRGCDPANGNSQCPVGYQCFVHPDSEVSGLGACLLDDEAERLADTCKPFLTSLRRYTVASTSSGELRLLPRRHTLRTTPVDGCIDDAQCENLADLAVRQETSNHPGDDTDVDEHAWTCETDPDRPAIATGKRCQLRCDVDEDCATGTVCQAGFCMEGVIPPQACVNAPERYELDAGDAFAVVGTRSGFLHRNVADATGRCVQDREASPLLVGRIPLDPPACDPSADPITGMRPDGTVDANPCALTADTTDVAPVYSAGCVVETSEFRVRAAPAIKFRNRSFGITLVDPTYPGDAECILDRGGTLGRIPLVYAGYQLAFDQTAGLAPMGLGVEAVLPVAVVRGPTQSIWVIDEGDFLSTSTSVASTRGKVFRVESTSLSLINILE
jgi:hypothetical protein